MTHYMNLKPQPFGLIASGLKTIELRLWDEKRQKIRIGDRIDFTNTDDEEQKIHCVVENLFLFPDFESLYAGLPLLDCGYLPEELSSASPRDMELYYTPQQQRQYGVVGIQIRLL